MSEIAIVARAIAVLALLVGTGFATARVGGRRVDWFAAVWSGAAALSLIGTVLARAGAFSLTSLGAGMMGLTFAAVMAARVLARETPPLPPASTPRVRFAAAFAGLAAVAWMWPPYETYLAAADSTMYVNAGVHLARTGSYDVPDTIASRLSPDLAKALFRSVGAFDAGPYIRLPGGLLMQGRSDTTATPAFFPLVSTWTGTLAAIGGPGFATMAAPLGMGMAVWALALFAGETFGLAAAAVTALVFLGNFAVWWFGRFTMSEPLTIAFAWSALVFLGRQRPLAAGVMLGLAGLARAETLVFAMVALACWSAWVPVAWRDLARIGAGCLVASVVAALAVIDAPNHHLAYLANDASQVWLYWAYRFMPAIMDGRLAIAAALAPLVPILLALVLVRAGGDVSRNTARLLLTGGVVVAAVLYAKLGGGLDTIRHCRWLATSMSPLGLACGVAGIVIVWLRGGRVGPLAVLLTLIVAAIFLPNPRVAPYQPWAMRRYLPVVLPGLALGAGVFIGAMFAARRVAIRVFAAVVAGAVFAWQLAPTLVARRAAYFAGSQVGITRLAEQVPDDALVVVDSSFADVQLQVPFWLMLGRESVMVSGEGPAWRELLSTLVATGRPVYWIQNAYAARPVSAGLAFTAVEQKVDLTIALPNSPIDTPPTAVMRKTLPLAIYGVAPGEGAGVSKPMRVIQSSTLVTPRPSRTAAVAPLASVHATRTSIRPNCRS